MVLVEDVDAVFNRAVAAGAKSLRAGGTQFYGRPSGQFEDRSAPVERRHAVEDVAPDEMERGLQTP